jgi:predicted anti-sigma-YlaC factor YlaD
MHNEYTVIMSEVLDREATAEQRLRLHDHQAECPICAATWDRWQSLDAQLSAAARLAPAPGFVLRVSARLAERQARTQRRRQLGSGLLLAWGASIGLLWLAVAGTLGWCLTHPTAVGELTSSGVYWLDGALWLWRTVQSTLVDLGGLWLSLGVGFYLGLTALVLFVWAALLLTKSDWLRSLFEAGDS